MNNFKKFLPLFAFILGIGLIVTQSAFKNSADVKYVLYNGVWYDLSQDPPQGKQFNCEISDDPCTVIYRDGAPDQGGMYVGDGTQLGQFKLIDAE